MVSPEEAKAQLVPWMSWITETWTWLYIGMWNYLFTVSEIRVSSLFRQNMHEVNKVPVQTLRNSL